MSLKYEPSSEPLAEGLPEEDALLKRERCDVLRTVTVR